MIEQRAAEDYGPQFVCDPFDGYRDHQVCSHARRYLIDRPFLVLRFFRSAEKIECMFRQDSRNSLFQRAPFKSFADCAIIFGGKPRRAVQGAVVYCRTIRDTNSSIHLIGPAGSGVWPT